MKLEVIEQINSLARRQIPFFLITDFLGNKTILHKIEKLPSSIHFSFPSFTTKFSYNGSPTPKLSSSAFIQQESYKEKFHKTQYHLHRGDSYLLNLTAKTKIELGGSNLEDIYQHTKAPFKVLLKNSFTLFSPEKFIEIKDSKISTFPMKGTIDASIPNAEEIILNSKKESAEHATIVDLLRNDLSIVAKNVRVCRYRFIDRVETAQRTLLQVSSQISGYLEENWRERLGDIISSLLPAGSVSGAPKAKTVDIIENIEEDSRGFYTGISLYFDGQNVESCVNIRFIEQSNENFFYRSGGGITANSNLLDEYNELKEKVYVPIY